MSHIVTIEAQVRDARAVSSACRRLGLAEPTSGTARLFSGAATGLAVQLPGWRYPVVCDIPSGRLRFDHFEGRWGDPRHLDRFLQMYAVEKAKLEARKQGHGVIEQALPDGSIKLTVSVGGAA